MKKCSTGTNCYIGNKKVPREQKNKICSVGLNLTVWNEKNVPLKLLHWNKKSSIRTKTKIYSVGSNLIIGTEKCFYWNKVISSKQMEKSVPPELFGREKKKKKEILYTLQS